MDSGKARNLFEKFAAAMCYVSVEKSNGDQGIGSAFHVGEGVFVTARHVVERMTILEIASTEHTYIRLEGDEANESRDRVVLAGEEFAAHRVENGVMQLSRGPFFHPDESVDVAVFQVADIDERTPYVPLGSHLDDWLGKSDFVLTEAIVLGYPPIPFTTEPILFAARAEVNALIDVRDTRHVHFVLSTMPRGGFSGGVALTESEFVLGVITRSLLSADTKEELGYFSVLSVEPIYNCLAIHKMLPDCQAEGWDDFWNADDVGVFYDPNTSNLLDSVTVVAHVSLFDDGKKVHLEVTCEDPIMLDSLVTNAESELKDFKTTRQVVRNGMIKLKVEDADYVEASQAIKRAADAACKTLRDSGLKRRNLSDPGSMFFPGQDSQINKT